LYNKNINKICILKQREGKVVYEEKFIVFSSSSGSRSSSDRMFGKLG